MPAFTMHHFRFASRSLLVVLAGLTAVLLVAFPVVGQVTQKLAARDAARFPASAAVIDVTQPPYSATGNGRTDDTEAIQRALDDAMGMHRIVYLPAGTYLISRSLRWSATNSGGAQAWGFNWVQGEHAERTTLRLKDHTAGDAAEPVSIMACGGFGSADWFHNYVQDITFDVGEGNPAAVGLQFYSNNSGAVRGCRFVAGPNSGSIGLDLARDMNGPLLVQDCEVDGYERGISMGRAVNGQTLERVSLRNQRAIGLANEGQTITIHGLFSQNRVPAIMSYGALCLIRAELKGLEGAKQLPAIINYNYGKIFVRDLKTSGYGRAMADLDTPDSAAAFRMSSSDQPSTVGPNIEQYQSEVPSHLFPIRRQALRLPIQDPPAIPVDPPAAWAVVDRFGADPSGERDSSEAIQRAIDSGAKTVFFPGHYRLSKTVEVRGAVQRLLGTGDWIDYDGQARPDFRVMDHPRATPVAFEHFSHVHGGVEIDTNRTVIFRSVSDCDLTFTPRGSTGELYLEDFVTHDLNIGQRHVWGRQVNIENEGLHLENPGGQLWLCGYKTERGGTLLATRGGGQSEILGGFSYTTTAGRLAPMFVVEEASLFAFFGEVCFNGDPFAVLVEEQRGGQAKTLLPTNGHTQPYSAIRDPAPAVVAP